MDRIASDAAALWGLSGDITLAARRENVVYRVSTATGDFALRLHRPGYRSDAELVSELHWMHALAAGGLDVPDPLARPGGGYLATLGGHQVDVLSWVPGRPLGKAGELSGIEDRPDFCRRLGAAMARLHDISDAWAPPADFTRPAWDRAGLLGGDPLWGRFWEHPHLTNDQKLLLETVRTRADHAFAEIESKADQGLIHADLLSENMMLGDDRLYMIDFDDGGWGFRDFDLATFLLRFRDAPDYPALQDALLEGYVARRSVRIDELALFMLLRALTYPGWIADRLGEPGAEERSERAIATALREARRWLQTQGG